MPATQALTTHPLNPVSPFFHDLVRKEANVNTVAMFPCNTVEQHTLHRKAESKRCDKCRLNSIKSCLVFPRVVLGLLEYFPIYAATGVWLENQASV